MKKGFSLIELLVSLVIISTAMVFITAFVLSLKDDKNNIVLDVPVLVDQTAISKELNNDAINYGISSIIVNNKTCNITYNNNATRTIEISNDNKTIKYYEGDEIYFVRTLKSATFGDITYNVENFENKKLYKYVIPISFNNKNYDVEVYYYGY